MHGALLGVCSGDSTVAAMGFSASLFASLLASRPVRTRPLLHLSATTMVHQHLISRHITILATLHVTSGRIRFCFPSAYMYSVLSWAQEVDSHLDNMVHVLTSKRQWRTEW